MTASSSFDSPSPNQYNLPSKIQEGPKYGIGLKTMDVSDKQKKAVPGPGQYDNDHIAFSSHVKKQPAYSLGSGQRPPIANLKDTPSPNQYKYDDVQK